MRTRKQLKPFPGFTVLALAAIPFALFGRSGRALPIRPTDPERLAELLASTGEYCERAKAIALHFICIEKITEIENFFEKISSPSAIIRDEKIFTTRRIKRRTYTYDYQLIKRGDEITENRTLLEENGKRKMEKNAPLKTTKFFSYNPVFGPVGFLGREWQGTYDYHFVREDTLDGVKAAVIEVRPKTLIEGKPNYGKIWVAWKDGSVLRIDVEQESLVGFEEIEAEAKKKGLKPLI